MHFGYRDVCSFSVYTPVEDQLLRVEDRIFILPTPKSKYKKVTISFLYLGVTYLFDKCFIKSVCHRQAALTVFLFILIYLLGLGRKDSFITF